MRNALPFAVVGGGLVLATLVLALAAGAGAGGGLPALRLRDPGGRSFDLASMEGRVWVAGFVSAGCLEGCAGLPDTLGRLHDGLPPGAKLVTFVLGGASLWPAPPAALAGRESWTVCQGNGVDADAETEVRRLALDVLGVPEAALSGLDASDPAAALVVVDRSGRPRAVRTLDRDGGGTASRRSVAATWGDVELLATLHPSAGRQSALHAAVLVLLGAGVALARRRLLRAHPAATGLAAALSLALLAPAFAYLDAAFAVAHRGSGWARPLYFTVVAAQTALTALVAVLALVAIVHAVRREATRHRALVRWLAPAWIAVSASGAAVYFLLARAFAGS